MALLRVSKSKLRDQLLATWALAAAMIGFVAAVAILGFVQGLGLLHAFLGGFYDPAQLGVTLSFFSAGLLITFGMFVIARWWSTSETLAAILAKITTIEVAVSSIKQDVSDYFNLAFKQLAAVIEDNASEWAGFVFRLITYNGTLSREVHISLLAGGQRYRMTADEERVYGNFLGRLQQPMQLIFIVYVARQLVGPNSAAEYLLRLVHIVRCCARRAGVEALKASVTVFLIDKPRPTATVFLGFKKENGNLAPRAIEYTRSLKPGDVSTPTSEQTFICHTAETRIRQLNEHVEREVQAPGTVEIDFNILERIIGPLLPAEDGDTAPVNSDDDWRRIIGDLYAAGESTPHKPEIVANADHLAFHTYRPSIHATRGKPLADVLSSPALTAPETPAGPVRAVWRWLHSKMPR